MKYLKNINELLRSTYLSAANKLEHDHVERSKELINWASENGENLTFDKIYYHQFIFNGSNEGEYYSIVNYDYKEVNESNRSTTLYLYFNIHMKSNWGNTKEITLRFKIILKNTYAVDSNKLRLEINRNDMIRNSDPKVARKNALHIFRFFNECWEDDLSKNDYKGYELQDLSVNRLYKS
jgi:hypothetical protein